MAKPYPEPTDYFFDNDPEDAPEAENNRLGLGAVLLLLLLIAAMLSTLMWPVIWQYLIHTNLPPTPTPTFLQQI